MLLIACLPFVGIPVGAAETSAALTGSIVRSDVDAPLAGARIHAGDPQTGQVFSSAPARPDGSFRLPDLPPATYSLAVEVDGGLYLVEAPLLLAPGATRTLNLSVSRRAMDTARRAKGPGAKTGFWDNPAWAALTAVGIATVVGFLIDDDDDDPVVQSPSAP